jgi:hypothetical protein
MTLDDYLSAKHVVIAHKGRVQDIVELGLAAEGLHRPRRSSRLGRRGKPWLLDLERRIPARDRFAPDSPLEEAGFEPSVPREIGLRSGSVNRRQTGTQLKLVVRLDPRWRGRRKRYRDDSQAAGDQIMARRLRRSELSMRAVG